MSAKLLSPPRSIVTMLPAPVPVEVSMERNHLIDGWRGLSVLLVVIGHLTTQRYQAYFQTKPLHVVFADSNASIWQKLYEIAMRAQQPLPEVGVDVFFIISGYLITSLLLREEEQNGSITLLAFYVRRFCRIMPAFFVYMGFIFALTVDGVVNVPGKIFVLSTCMLCDLPAAPCNWFFGHIWSLSVEEQYYLVWPSLFAVLGRWRAVGVLVVLGGFFAASFAFPLMLSFSYIAVGGLYALSVRARYVIDAIGTRSLIAIFIVAILTLPFYSSYAALHRLVSLSQPLLLAVVFFGTLRREGPLTMVVELRLVQMLGSISYSVYLWQQLWTAPSSLHGSQMLLNLPFLLFIPAIFSYLLVEKPMITVGHRWSAVIMARNKHISSHIVA